MNYNEYNKQLNLSDYLYEKTLAGVKSGISKHNHVQKRRKTVLFSAAACFVVLACSISAVKYLSKNSPSNALESTVNTPTENSNKDSNIIFNTEETKYPHKIIINNKIYSQYYFGDEKGDKNNTIELKQSEIGELICEIDYFNLTDDLTDFASMSIEEAKDNKFYKAKVYMYAKAKSNNLIIVQAKDEYYLFYLNGLTTDYTIEDLLNIYTAEGANEIIGIEVWQNELYDYTIELPEADTVTGQDSRPLLKGTIKNKEALQSILSILKKEHPKRSTDNIYDYLSDYEKGLTSKIPLMSDLGEYELRIVFADGYELNLDKISLDISLHKGFFYFNICNKGNLICYSLETSDYDKLVKLIESSI